jgi:hypothetical protein
MSAADLSTAGNDLVVDRHENGKGQGFRFLHFGFLVVLPSLVLFISVSAFPEEVAVWLCSALFIGG